MKNGKLIIACAGAGKTTQLVEDVLGLSEEKRILITTFTDSNTEIIKQKFVRLLGFVPKNVRIMPLYSFELKELIKPYLFPAITREIKGILMEHQGVCYHGWRNVDYYLRGNRIFNSKISELAFRTIDTIAYTLKRLREMFDYIFVDEAQDLSSYDLDLMAKIANSGFDITLYADPRQSTFKTSNGNKNSGFKDVCDYIKRQCPSLFNVDESTLRNSQRCTASVMRVASKLFPMYPQSSGTAKKGDIYLLDKSKCDEFIRLHPKCKGLREKVTSNTDGINIPFVNIGLSKGDTFESTLLVIPMSWTKCIIKRGFDGSTMKPKSKAALYVALTRSLGDVGIVTDACTIASCTNGDLKIFD